MKIIEGIEIVKVDDKVIGVTTGDAINIYKGIINLNESAYRIWKLFEEGLNYSEAAEKLTQEHKDLSYKQAYDYVKEFGDKLIEKGILVEE